MPRRRGGKCPGMWAGLALVRHWGAVPLVAGVQPTGVKVVKAASDLAPKGDKGPEHDV